MRSQGRPRIASVASTGYTLVEMLVALVMFAMISVATAFLMSGALRGNAMLTERTREAQEARALLNVISRDLRSAFAVTGSPATYFVATGADSGPVLQFTTLASRLMPDLAVMAGLSNADSVLPQSDILQVTYDYDPSTHVLSRLTSALTGLDTLPEPGQPEYILSRRVALITFTFVDASGNVRNDWNLQTAATSGTDQVDTTGLDTTLPSQILVELELDRSSGETIYLSTRVVPANITPQPAGQRPAEPQQPAGDAGGGGPGDAGGGGGGGAPGGGGGTP